MTEVQVLREQIERLTTVVRAQATLLGHLSGRMTNCEHVSRIRHDGGQDEKSLRFPAGYSPAAYLGLLAQIEQAFCGPLNAPLAEPTSETPIPGPKSKSKPAGKAGGTTASTVEAAAAAPAGATGGTSSPA